MDVKHIQKAAAWHDRAAILDEIRGLFILLMVVYHGLYNLTSIFGWNLPWFYSKPMQILQLFIAGDLIFISGACCRYSRSNMKRGLQVFGWGMVLTVVTAWVLPSQTIRFGVLHCLGLSMVIFAILKKFLDILHPWSGLLMFLVLFLGTYFIASGYLGLPPLLIALPQTLYRTPYLFWLGFPQDGFVSSDYFSLMPWTFFFLAGSYFGIWVKEGRLPHWCYVYHSSLLRWAGKRALVIYLLHQPLLYGGMLLLFRLL